MRDEPLLATCWTSAGDAAPLRGNERSPFPLRDRIEAVAQAGFRGFGLIHADLLVAEQQYGLAGIRSVLHDNGLTHIELELLTDWWASGPARQRSDAVRRTLLTAAEALGAHHIKVAPDVSDGPWDHAGPATSSRHPASQPATRMSRTLGPPSRGAVRA